ncbi:MAG: acyl-CoA dehydrogenase family protein [Nitrospiraceae bacterium]
MTTYRELDLRLTAEQQKLKQDMHDFSKSVLMPAALSLDRLPDPQQVIDQNSPLWTTFKVAYARGIHTALIPKACGGMGLIGLDAHLVFEELGWGSAEFAAALAVSGFPFAMAAATAKSDLIEELVTPFVAEKDARQVGCWAITEPDHGSDQFMGGTPQFRDPEIFGQVTARMDGSDYLINGQKAAWVSNGTIATHSVTYLTLDRTKGMAGGGVAFIPLNLPGVSKGKPLDKMGQRALNQGSITFTNVRIPKRYMLFDATSYETILNLTLVLTNGLMGAVFTGVARAAYEQALAYSKTRRQGGKPISEHQLVQKHLFDMFTKVETSRALSRAAMVYNASAQPPALEYSIASKVYCTQACLEVTDTALQLFGGRGLTREYPIEKLYRDARASLIEDGANDVLALVGARQLLSHSISETA